MPDLTIDGLKISVPEGTNVLEAAERLGIMIPRFCWHPALGAAGACRMCAVMFVDGPVKGLDMSCMVKARDAMVVETGHPEAVAFRRHVAELLMLHHPHDCPVCEEGGHCLLQDMTISAGHGLRHFTGKKRTYRNQDLGPLIDQEMNRCIHCYVCVRYYQEFAGGRDFGANRISGDVAYGRYQPGPLESPFAGNLADVCPTGVFVDKPSRHKARHWDLEKSPSVCLCCSLGCNVTVSSRYRSVISLEARLNPAVNGHFVCDRGRQGYQYDSLPERPRQARIDGAGATMEAALDEAARRVERIASLHGGEAVACLGSSRQSLESQGTLALLASAAGWRRPEYASGSHRKKNMLAAVAGLGKDLHVSQAGLAAADCILMVGAALLSEAPMAALAVRQARRNGAIVAVIDPRPVRLPFDFIHITARRHDMEAALGAVLSKAFPDADQEGRDFLAALGDAMPDSAAPPGWEEFSERLAVSGFPVVVCGSDIVRLSTPALAAGAARLMKRARGHAGFFPLLAGANAFGAALMNPDPEESFDDVLEAVEQGRVKALVCAESDPLARFADHRRIQAALARLELLVSLDYLPSATSRKAHVFLPSRTVFEEGGSFLNNEGRLQTAWPSHACGDPLGMTVSDGHPPRTYSPVVPGSAPLACWEILEELGSRLGYGFGHDFTPWAAACKAAPALADLPRDTQRREGALVLPATAPGATLAARPSAIPPEALTQADLIITEQAFGTEELSSYGPILKSLAPVPQVLINTQDAGSIELREEDYVFMACPVGQVNCYLRLEDTMARSTVVLPRRPDSGWRHAVARGYTVELALLRKEAWESAGEPGQAPGKEAPDEQAGTPQAEEMP